MPRSTPDTVAPPGEGRAAIIRAAARAPPETAANCGFWRRNARMAKTSEPVVTTRRDIQ